MESTLFNRLWPKLVNVAAAGILVLMAVLFAMQWRGPNPRLWATGEPRFGDLTKHYAAGLFWREGRVHDIYFDSKLGDWQIEYWKGEGTTWGFNYIYSPLVAWVCSLFAGMSPVLFQNLWFAFSLGLLVPGLGMMRIWLPPEGRAAALLYLCGLPAVFYGLVLGQNHLLTWVIVLGTAWLLKLGRPVAAGLVLSALSLYKPQFVPVLAGLLLLLGEWKFFLSAGFASLGWLVLSILAFGWEPHGWWLQVITNMGNGAQNQIPSFNQTWAGFWYSLFPGAGGKLLAYVLPSIVITALPAVFWILKLRRMDGWTAGHSLLALLPLAILISPYVSHYDLLLMGPWWLAVVTGLKRRGWRVGLGVSFWMISLASFNFSGQPLALMAPLLTAWYWMSLFLAAREDFSVVK